MNYTNKELSEILDNAPDDAVFWDGEDYLDLDFCFQEHVTNYWTGGKPSEKITYKKDPINTGKLRRSDDLREILNLKDQVEVLNWCRGVW